MLLYVEDGNLTSAVIKQSGLALTDLYSSSNFMFDDAWHLYSIRHSIFLFGDLYAFMHFFLPYVCIQDILFKNVQQSPLFPIPLGDKLSLINIWYVKGKARTLACRFAPDACPKQKDV